MLIEYKSAIFKSQYFYRYHYFWYGISTEKKRKTIAGEIYISIERVKENAKKFNTKYANELHRVMIHGVLHLCGFKDKKAIERAKMSKLEDQALICLKDIR